jgi:hypothetical protein
MEYLGSSLDSSAERGRLVVTDRVRDAIGYLCRAGGPQALVVAWPDGVAYLPVAMFSPSEFDVIIGHVAGCRVFADVRQLGVFADRHAVLDVAESMSWPERSLLRLRAAPCGDSHRVAPQTGGRDAVTVARSRQVGLEISAELYGEFRGLLSDEAIRGCVREAMTDLRSSISRNALPEMAVRLARVRLAALAKARAAPAFSAPATAPTRDRHPPVQAT